MKLLKTITKSYNKFSPFGKILIFLTIFLCIVMLFKKIKPSFEGMTTNSDSKIVLKDNDDIYDNFYVNIYDYLVFSSAKNNYEVGSIMNDSNPVETSVIADIGCGTGHHVDMLSKKNLKVIGIDKSNDMIEMARNNYPSGNFKVGDALDSNLFQMNSLTHVLCLYFTIYYIKDKQKFFDNAMRWLMPGGYLIVHLVDREDFDPIIPTGNPLYMVSPQKYAKERITNTKVTFNEFVYTSDFNLESDKNIATFDEKFKFNDGKIRKQQQILYMNDTTNIVNLAQNSGFILEAKTDMVKCGYEKQYLYTFLKPA
jgi:ubiquinone/menaquinone biosynthesis C-methylase UbiE